MKKGLIVTMIMLFGFTAYGSIKNGSYTCTNKYGDMIVKISDTGLSIDGDKEIKYNAYGDRNWQVDNDGGENMFKLLINPQGILLLTNFDSLGNFSSLSATNFNMNKNGILVSVSSASVSTDLEDEVRGEMNCK